MVKILIGDILQSKAQAIVNTVNCVGVMGKGIAAEFKEKYPAMYQDYVKKCQLKQVEPGKPYLYSEAGIYIINFPTKNHWRSPSHINDIINGLDFLVAHINTWNIKSIAIPPLGCGNGGLDWLTVGPLIYQKVSSLPISIEMYAPYGTPQHQLSLDFIKQQKPPQMLKGEEQKKINPAWLTLLEVIYQLAQQPYTNPIGRTIFQKIAYILTEQGVETGFQFQQASYGPFSNDVINAIKVFTNTNLIQEKMLGRMLAIHVGSAYIPSRDKHQLVIKKYNKEINKTVDLFSRIKNTEQAEEVATVLFSSRKLKIENPTVSERELYDFILKWKKSWNNENKKKTIADTIRNLEILGWVKLQPSECFSAELQQL